MRILSIPGRRTSTQYIKLFCESLDEAGLVVVDVDARDALLLRFDVLHLHFPHFYIVEQRPIFAVIWFCIFAAVFALLKITGKRIVFTVHDVTPFHTKNEWLIWPFLGMVYRATDGFVFLNQSSQAEFYRRNPAQMRKSWLMLGHAAYPVPAPDPAVRRQHRQALIGDTDALLVGYLGYRQAHKGLDLVTMVPERLASGRSVRLLVAGATQASFAAEAEAILSRVPAAMLTRIDRRLSDSELNALTQSVDVVLMPYTLGWNTGMGLLVLSNRARLLASALPMFIDLENAVGAPWVYTCADNAGFATELERLAGVEPDEAQRSRLEQYLEDNSYARGAARLSEFYRDLVIGQRSLLNPMQSRAH